MWFKVSASRVLSVGKGLNMASIATVTQAQDGASDLLSRLVDAEGSAGHRYIVSADLNSGRFATRNLADAIHHLCTLHGRHPGVLDHAAVHTANDGARGWLISAVDGFAGERAVLAKLVVAVGPLPSTPGQAESESAVNGQRHALDMLAQSDRDGCALGAAMALVLDWHTVRGALDTIANRLGVMIPDAALPTRHETLAVAASVATTSGIERAMAFGAQQLLGQHRGLWDLLNARQIARGEY
jgi:hypothetical protein